MYWGYMANVKTFIAGGCSFTFGHELSDDINGKEPSKKSWAYQLFDQTRYPGTDVNYVTVAHPGTGNPGIARRVFNAVSQHDNEQWKRRQDLMIETGVKPFAEAIYKHAANEYHETYLSWKSIIWLQNILEKKKIKFMFTLADNSLFYKDFDHHKDQDRFMKSLHKEIDFTKWFSFGDRMMGFNQWALMENYPRGTTHPLDLAHQDAVKLMIPEYKKILTGGK